ncbi:type II toxin-antitoxin system RelE/ParE family toxin [Pseudomonas sp. CGJS7]|uniref:type II toxin-antitoxin system RelE/ParE family toxin n=1 Tax=Pseudomonas sp. CGJS7 TaxID=3109348 RepID=UPI00300B46E6
MARIEFAPEVLEDFDRILDHLIAHEVAQTGARIEGIVNALDVLADNPLIGRGTDSDLRELIIGQDTRGYVALYRYVQAIETVFVLAIRAQKEAGYARL